ncbi:PglZ domain-containing protein [Clostridium estertheticum]|uniref:PglZ domain-containing protein n=1 Tax=Clostridium estertheticum TaxID=238834 RepID=UPI001CF5CB65|nr:PglZ domain-containing protein [Clostridium estertheticum]MCB2305627.1 PglZ domain-containing protein [Clostridium estertheticum]MCB2344557.1 PglZ domain-containing protein [Clostridium estertheticum]MCB2347983.1 PglZ domain-containing protein [Clostridium estertheticum]WAG45627.1 PglZ domain-containing protein [Clostridium estertheticum]
MLSAGWEPNQILDKLWYEGALQKVREVLQSVETEERRQLEKEFLELVRTWLDVPRRAIVEAAILESNPPPVLPICLLASILEGWGMLTSARMREFLEGSELGDLFVDVLKDGYDLSGLSEWGRRIIKKEDIIFKQALEYLQHDVFPKHPNAVTESLACVVKGVGGKGAERLLNQLIRVLEADGGVLAQGLEVTLHALLDVTVDGENIDRIPFEPASCKLIDKLETSDSPQWAQLLSAIRHHQSRGQYEYHISLLEDMITIHRLTDLAEVAIKKLNSFDWKAWIDLLDNVYLPLSNIAFEVERRSNQLPEKINVYRITQRAKEACDSIRVEWADFYVDSNRGLPKWLRERDFAVDTCRPWLNSDVVEFAVQPLLKDSEIKQVFLIVFDGMSVSNWTLLRDRFLMVPGRELFRTYQALRPEYRVCSYLPSITEYCRQAIFAGAPPNVFRSWPYGNSESNLMKHCLDNLGLSSLSQWDSDKNYLCYNEKDANVDTLNRKMRDIIDSPGRLKAIVFNLQDRLLQKGMSSLQEIMLAYVKEVALPHLRRISGLEKTAVVITADHGFTWYDQQYIIDDLKQSSGLGREVFIHNRCLEYKTSKRTNVGPKDVKCILPLSDFGLPSTYQSVEIPFDHSSYGWPSTIKKSNGNPYTIQGNDHGGLTPEETIVPLAIYLTKGV